MAKVTTLFQHESKPTWFENIAYRPSKGTILATNLLSPTLTEVDPSGPPYASSTILSIPSVESLTGITHIKDDIFAIGAGEYSLQKGPVSGSWAVYLADLSVSPPKVEEVVKLSAGLINGITTWDENTILVTDCSIEGGLLYKVDIAKKTCEKSVDVEEMKCPPNPPFPVPINGVKVYRKGGETWIYWTNTTRGALYRVPVSDELATTGPVEKVAEGLMPDDFILAENGTAYITHNVGNTVLKVDKVGGDVITVAGKQDSLELGGITALAFGKGEDILYASTSGAFALPVNGTETEPAKVVEIRLK